MYANHIINRFMDFDANRIIIEQSLLHSNCHCFLFFYYCRRIASADV